uniref:Uncharacterized protein n=1 Tax=Siphoviridae sp. ctZHD14 TaxID=2827891 RepID=A0A8S5SWD3_9CAUD|nr:MAG TPA: hypothetical protein [Siphoviridae sp. ctZHD14]
MGFSFYYITILAKVNATILKIYPIYRYIVPYSILLDNKIKREQSTEKQ